MTIEELVAELQDCEKVLDAMVKGLCPKLPPVNVPEIDLDEPPDPLISSEMDFVEHVRIMQDRKDYN